MKLRILFLFFVASAVFSVSLQFFSCSAEAKQERSDHIRLRWVKAFPAETWSNVETGIYWSLSYLGAELDTSMKRGIITREDSAHFTLDLSKAGFDSTAIQAFGVIIDSLKNSGEYTKFNSIDLARFLVLTEHSSNHYYAITGTAKTYSEFRERHPGFSGDEFNVYKSGVAVHNRKIHFCLKADVTQMAWIAEEGTGSIDSGTFVTTGYEVYDVMKNGQLRFAVYDVNGNLAVASDPKISAAGKPSKCMWCHELSVLPLFVTPVEPATGISVTQFISLVDSSQHMLDAYRQTLHSLIDFSQKQAHTQGELLYISFMEPSAYRLGNEWGVDTLAVKKRMGNIGTHVYTEFQFLGNSWYRNYADSVCGYSATHVPLSVREPNEREPDLLHVSGK